MIDSDTDPAPTWLYDGTDWRVIMTPHRPLASPSVLAYDPSRRSIVALTLFDFATWRFDGRDWSRLTPPSAGEPTRLASGAPRQSPEVAFDPTRGTWTVFGGFDDSDNRSTADTWIGTGSTWKNVSPLVAPVGREAGRTSLAWDPAERRLLMFGGELSLGSTPGCYDSVKSLDLSDSWTWDGTTWAHAAQVSLRA
jgi:hypothetical protein